MHRTKLIFAVLMAITAITAIGAATASAELGFLPREPFSGKSPAGTLEATGGAKITCASDTLLEGTFEAEKDKHGKIASIHFLKCLALGSFPANSLGDEKEVILVTNVLWLACIINKEKLELGVLIELPSGGVHIEVPAAKLLFTVKGSVVGKVLTADNKKAKLFEVEFKQKAGIPSITKCEGEAADKLVLELEGKEPEESGLTGKEEVEPVKETELMES